MELARRIAHDVPDIDQTLPLWARRNNPIVRRQLGMYWRVFPPQAGPIMKWYSILCFVLLLTVFVPGLLVFILTFLLAGILLMPFAAYVYVRALGEITNSSSRAMAIELEQDTLDLLRATPISTQEIILSKISASVWRWMDDLEVVISATLFLGMPAILMIYLNWWPPEENNLFLPQVMTMVTFAASILRLPLEMFMAASLGTMMGAATGLRSTAFLGTAAMLFFYFLLINLARLLNLTWPAQLMVDAVLPVALPAMISWAAVRFTTYLLTHD